MYRVMFSFIYYLRLFGLKLKFLWDTLNHYLLLKFIAKTLWKEKLITCISAGFLYYFTYFRPTYVMRPAEQFIWIQDVTQRYDKQLRETAKQAVKKDVFGNPDLPPKIAPLLVQLVQ